MGAAFKKPNVFSKELEGKQLTHRPGWRTDSKVNFYQEVR